jgi:trk system potassium uptake protein TrkA
MKRNFKGAIDYCVIGLGRFGFALSVALSQAGKEVLVLDNDEEKVKAISRYVDNALIIKHLDKEALEEAGVQNCHTVVVCIGEQIEVSVLTTLNVIELGVPRVISKAVSTDHGSVLKKIGAEVVYPEKDMAIRLAKSFVTTRAIEYIDLNEEISIEEHKITGKIGGQTLATANLRKRFGMNAIAIVKGDKTIIEVEPTILLEAGDSIVTIGTKDNHGKFQDYLFAD